MLTWNLLHGRSVPGARRDLFEEFTVALAEWEWDAALLQEVPPWWPAALGVRLGAQERSALTSRNFGLPLRRVIAERWPDVIKSNGGGCNAILVRRDEPVSEHRVRRLARLPERRWVHAVRLRSGLWLGNTHTEARVNQGRAAAAATREWAGEEKCVLGGDFNVPGLTLDGFETAGGHGVDQVFARGLAPVKSWVLERGRLSDHAPVLVELEA